MKQDIMTMASHPLVSYTAISFIVITLFHYYKEGVSPNMTIASLSLVGMASASYLLRNNISRLDFVNVGIIGSSSFIITNFILVFVKLVTDINIQSLLLEALIFGAVSGAVYTLIKVKHYMRYS